MRVLINSLKVLAVLLAVLAAVNPVRAASISIALSPGTPSGTGPYTWTYDATLPKGFQLQPSPAPCAPSAPVGAICDGLITIYDFAGYIPGSEFAPTDWAFMGQLLGPTPIGVVPGTNVAGVDNSSIFNLAWIYTGAGGGGIISAINTDIALGSFGANSVYGIPTPSEYATRSNSLAVPNGRAISSDTTLVPAVPEPASLLLLGTGLLGLALAARRRLASNGTMRR